MPQVLKPSHVPPGLGKQICRSNDALDRTTLGPRAQLIIVVPITGNHCRLHYFVMQSGLIVEIYFYRASTYVAGCENIHIPIVTASHSMIKRV